MPWATDRGKVIHMRTRRAGLGVLTVLVAGGLVLSGGARPAPATAASRSTTQPDPGTSNDPGPASGAPSIATAAKVPDSGRPLTVSSTKSLRTAAAPAPTSGLARAGSLAAPAAAPSASGWITSKAWNIVPAMGAPTPPMPVFARDIVLGEAPQQATLTIAGVGLYAPTVNGRPVSSAVLQPGTSDFAQSIEYRSYDVTALLAAGRNRLGVELGTGVYDEVSLPDRYSKLTHIGGPLGFTARLDVTDSTGTTSFDTSKDWWARSGGTQVSDWYGGESYDASQRPDALADPSLPIDPSSGWAPAVVADISSSVSLYGQSAPPVTAGTPVPSATVTRLGSGDWLVDFGAYVTGQPQLQLAAPAGRVLRMYPAERLAGGVPDQSTSTGKSALPIFDEYTFAGSGTETWHPQFVYHGFRYLRVTGVADLDLTPAMFSVVPVKADLPGAGSFTSSSAQLNSIVSLTNTSIDANLQSVLTDCSNREKLGWLEQDYLLFGLLSGRYDMSVYGPNLVRLMREAQHTDGSMPEIVPEVVRFRAPFDNDVNWGAALVMVPWNLYRTYGDTDTLAQTYPAMKRYVTSLQSHASGNLLKFGLGDWATLAPGAQRDVTTSMGYYGVVTTMARTATALGRTDDATAYAALAAQIKTAINAAYYRDKMYGSEQGTNAMALVLGLTPDVQASRGVLVSLMGTWSNHFTLGEVGLDYVFTALHDMGRDDLLWNAVTAPTAPSFASFVTSGAPALPEYWSGMNGSGSLAHFMLGRPAQWAQDGLAGIDQTDDSVGYRHLLIRPAVFTGPDSVTATRNTPAGWVKVAWTRSSGSAHITVTVPAGSSARVVLPSGTTEVAAGTWSFDTPLGTRASYGATGFVVPTGTVTRVPWSPVLFASVSGVQARITYAQWQATGFRTPVTRLPAGSVVAYAPSGSALFAWTPDRQVHQLTYSEWKQLGYPAPVRVPRPVTKYQWSKIVWMTTRWKTDPTTWTVKQLTSSEWVAMGSPRPADNVVTPQSKVFKYSGRTTIYLTDPSGFTHALTYAEWSHLGYPKPTVLS